MCNWCKKCEAKKAQSPKSKQNKKLYRNKNKETLNVYSREYRVKNKTSLKEFDIIRSKSLTRRYQALKSKGPARGLKVDISFEAYCVLVQQNKCIYCDGALPETGSGLDRKDNNIGYTIFNSVPCCYKCNTMKGAHLTYDEMMLIWAIRKGKIAKPVIY